VLYLYQHARKTLHTIQRTAYALKSISCCPQGHKFLENWSSSQINLNKAALKQL